MDAELLLWTKIAAIGQAVGAIATAAAVMVSLYVVLTDRRVSIDLRAGLRVIVPGINEKITDVISISITNTGFRPVEINSVGWRAGWARRMVPKWARYEFAMQTPSQNAYTTTMPFRLEPGQQKTIFVLLKDFNWEAYADRNIDMFTRKIPFKKTRITGNIHIQAYMTMNLQKSTKVERGLEIFLATGKKPNHALKSDQW